MLAFSKKKLAHTAVVDPGFSRGWGANPPGVPTYDFAKFSQKLHEIERIWTPRGDVKNFTIWFATVLI